MEVGHFNQRQLAARWDISQASLERWRSEDPARYDLGQALPGHADAHRQAVLAGGLAAFW